MREPMLFSTAVEPPSALVYLGLATRSPRDLAAHKERDENNAAQNKSRSVSYGVLDGGRASQRPRLSGLATKSPRDLAGHKERVAFGLGLTDLTVPNRAGTGFREWDWGNTYEQGFQTAQAARCKDKKKGDPVPGGVDDEYSKSGIFVPDVSTEGWFADGLTGDQCEGFAHLLPPHLRPAYAEGQHYYYYYEAESCFVHVQKMPAMGMLTPLGKFVDAPPSRQTGRLSKSERCARKDCKNPLRGGKRRRGTAWRKRNPYSGIPGRGLREINRIFWNLLNGSKANSGYNDSKADVRCQAPRFGVISDVVNPAFDWNFSGGGRGREATQSSNQARKNEDNRIDQSRIARNRGSTDLDQWVWVTSARRTNTLFLSGSRKQGSESGSVFTVPVLHAQEAHPSLGRRRPRSERVERSTCSAATENVPSADHAGANSGTEHHIQSPPSSGIYRYRKCHASATAYFPEGWTVTDEPVSMRDRPHYRIS
ncbi:uncharacterized protein EV422DRAFT_509139 [Fimicolochytrium jonesii]|uniref:uncharacterized protein n=1 Tax=Fimicolochytrium jonesii TaxID=1396493 RepID=UPI0022FE52DF|nr:uncharacterized protein EV422DRAFT_509139 [Fimicolochytrium jonesii]KAI8817313.1 hypothetical protein EV422DRAFT_509139 [Fimicolochytrium jonesii]